ncbi:MAG: STAS domain-containing protein [Solirubrobacteraceae bacterium]
MIDHPIRDVPGLRERLRVLLEGSDDDVIACDVSALPPDAVTVDALARLQLTARRCGRRIRLHRASHELHQLLLFVGLADAVGAGPGLELRPDRQAEEREHPGRVEERVDRGDAAL